MSPARVPRRRRRLSASQLLDPPGVMGARFGAAMSAGLGIRGCDHFCPVVPSSVASARRAAQLKRTRQKRLVAEGLVRALAVFGSKDRVPHEYAEALKETCLSRRGSGMSQRSAGGGLFIICAAKLGGKIYAEVPPPAVDRFSIVVAEGDVYVFTEFVVVDDEQPFKPFPNKYIIQFTASTTIEPAGHPQHDIPNYILHLTPFKELASGIGNQGYFIDVIGVVVQVSEINLMHLAPGDAGTPRRTIVLEDLRNNQINVVLWGARALDFDSGKVHELGQEVPVVVIFVGTLIKTFDGDCVLTGGAACRWYINKSITDIEDTLASIPEDFKKIASTVQHTYPYESRMSTTSVAFTSVAALLHANPCSSTMALILFLLS